MKKSLSIGVILLFILSALAPIGLGLNVKTDVDIDNHLYPEYYDAYSIDEIYGYEPIENVEVEPEFRCIKSKEIESFKQLTESLDGPMDSAWPMYCHDVRHTGLSPYNTESNPYEEIWRYPLSNVGYHSVPVVDNNGTIFVGRGDIYSINSNGTLNWEVDTFYTIVSSPIIDDKGIVYVGTGFWTPNYFYAINPEGSVKWKTAIHHDIESSAVIDDNGSIYFGCNNGYLYALHTSNGTLKWKFKTNGEVFSSPAIGLDGVIYFGSIDNYIYALYPNNGTLKWKFNTGTWVHGSQTIADDGTVYGVSDTSLYALNPDYGEVIWTANVGPVWGSPAIDSFGNIYVGTWTMRLYKISPNGDTIWRYDAPGRIWFGMSPAISSDGYICFGTTWMDGGEGAFIILNPDGTKRFRDEYGLFESSPAIGEDGTVYICSSHSKNGESFGYLRAFNELDPNAPLAPNINGPSTAKEDIVHEINFTSTSPLNRDVSYYVEWGDGKTTDWNGPHKSGEEITLSHVWLSPGTYTIRARAKDSDNLWGPWGEFEIEITRPRTRTSHWMQLLDIFPILQRLLQILA